MANEKKKDYLRPTMKKEDKTESIVSSYYVHGRFSAHVFPRGGFHMEALCETLKEAEKELENLKKHGGYSDGYIERVDVLFVNGLYNGAVSRGIIKRFGNAAPQLTKEEK